MTIGNIRGLLKFWLGKQPRPDLQRHEDSFLSLDQTSIDRRLEMPYRKTYQFPGEFIDPWHKRLTEVPRNQERIDLGIEGWLLPADALKLYELAYFCDGDILELGSYRGLSTSLLARATETSGTRGKVISIDLDPQAELAVKRNLKGLPGANRVRCFTDDAARAVRNLAAANRRFEFAFIDHAHDYQNVLELCRSLAGVLKPGAFALFHDFNDTRNSDAKDPDYGVYQGVAEGLPAGLFEFWGIYGCTGLFRYIGSA